MKTKSPLLKTLGNDLNPYPMTSDKEQYKEKVIDYLKEKHFIPTNICNSIVREYSNDVNWGRMFCQSAERCAERIYNKYANGKDPIKLNAE